MLFQIAATGTTSVVGTVLVAVTVAAVAQLAVVAEAAVAWVAVRGLSSTAWWPWVEVCSEDPGTGLVSCKHDT